MVSTKLRHLAGRKCRDCGEGERRTYICPGCGSIICARCWQFTKCEPGGPGDLFSGLEDSGRLTHGKRYGPRIFLIGGSSFAVATDSGAPAHCRGSRQDPVSVVAEYQAGRAERENR